MLKKAWKILKNTILPHNGRGRGQWMFSQRPKCHICFKPFLREAAKMQNVPKGGEVHNFPLYDVDSFEVGKKLKIDESPPLDQSWEKIEM